MLPNRSIALSRSSPRAGRSGALLSFVTTVDVGQVQRHWDRVPRDFHRRLVPAGIVVVRGNPRDGCTELKGLAFGWKVTFLGRNGVIGRLGSPDFHHLFGGWYARLCHAR